MSIMKIILAINIIFYVKYPGAVSAEAEQCPEDDDSFHSKETRLRKNLLCNYDSESRPVKDHNTAMQVTLDLFLNHIETSSEMLNGESFIAHTLMSLEWMDEYLVWNSTEHNDIDMVRIYSDKIWVPEILLYNSETNPVTAARSFSSDCLVHNDGQVMCVTQTSHSASCKADFSRWPFDALNCSLVFTMIMYRGEAVNITQSWNNDKYILQMYRPNRFWHMESINVTRSVTGIANNTRPFITYNMVLRRQSATHATLITAPALVMISITVTSILLRVSASERIYLLAVNVLLHFVYLEHLSWYVPSHGDKCPLVVIFYRNSMIMTAIVLITTALLKMLTGRNTALPNWVDTIIAVSNSTPGRWVMYASDDTDDMDKIVNDNSGDMAAKEQQRNAQDWKNFVKIANRLLLLVILLTYLGLFIGMILY